jgi:hypothetical protein
MTFRPDPHTLPIFGEANRRLGQIEQAEGVTVLFACESGSRAWGFPSPDSDYDVRYIYVHPTARYVGLNPPRDVIERDPDGEWDVDGWDLRKALSLLLKGNATLAEWLNSPIVYRENSLVAPRLRDLIKRHASAERSARHYYGMTNKCYLGDIANPGEANLKKYLYAVRGALCLDWIARYDEVPPMDVPRLLSHLVIATSARAAIDELLARKRVTGELGKGERIPPLDALIEANLAWAKSRGFDQIGIDPQFASETEALLLDVLGVPI